MPLHEMPLPFVERNGSGVELRILDYENRGFNPLLKPLASFVPVHSLI